MQYPFAIDDGNQTVVVVVIRVFGDFLVTAGGDGLAQLIAVAVIGIKRDLLLRGGVGRIQRVVDVKGRGPFLDQMTGGIIDIGNDRHLTGRGRRIDGRIEAVDIQGRGIRPLLQLVALGIVVPLGEIACPIDTGHHVAGDIVVIEVTVAVLVEILDLIAELIVAPGLTGAHRLGGNRGRVGLGTDQGGDFGCGMLCLDNPPGGIEEVGGHPHLTGRGRRPGIGIVIGIAQPGHVQFDFDLFAGGVVTVFTQSIMRIDFSNYPIITVIITGDFVSIWINFLDNIPFGIVDIGICWTNGFITVGDAVDVNLRGNNLDLSIIVVVHIIGGIAARIGLADHVTHRVVSIGSGEIQATRIADFAGDPIVQIVVVGGRHPVGIGFADHIAQRIVFERLDIVEAVRIEGL